MNLTSYQGKHALIPNEKEKKKEKKNIADYQYQRI